MPYLLEHAFDPDFDHNHLKPVACGDGCVDHFELGYAQTVAKGSELARMRPLEPGEEMTSADPRFVIEERRFPMGMGCMVDPGNKDRLLAAADGYVFYLNGKIHVKSVLNIRGDVDFRTGNIRFRGDVTVHGSVRTGFSVEGREVVVRDVVEGAMVRANGSIATEGGFKGGGIGLLQARERITVPFCENGTLATAGSLVIKNSAMHCSLYVGEHLAVRGQLVGGLTVCRKVVYVGGVLGSGMGETQLVLGYDAMLLREDASLDEKIAQVAKRLRCIRNLGRKRSQLSADEVEARENLKAEMVDLRLAKRSLWQRVHAREKLEECRVVIPGEVRPGVEISIGDAYVRITEPLSDVMLFREGHEICISSPAMPSEGA